MIATSLGTYLAWTSAGVVLIITLATAITGLLTKARADELKKRLDQSEQDRAADKLTAAAAEVECAAKIGALNTRIDDLTNGWLERLAPQVSRLMVPYLVDDLVPPLVEALKESAK